MPMQAKKRYWTVQEVLDLPPDGNRYEVVAGELLVTPAPTVRHQWLAGELYARLRDYLRAEGLGTAFMAPLDFYIDDDVYVQPDLLVVPGSLDTLPEHWRDIPRPLLVAEILSPGSLRADRFVKRHRYQRYGVDEYWIVDPAWRTIERWRPESEDGDTIDDELVWHPKGASAPFRMKLAEYFPPEKR